MRHHRPMARTASPREILIVADPGVRSLDVAGSSEVFSAAARLIEPRLQAARSYRVAVLKCKGERAALTAQEPVK
jgi:hypothetical protein